jgi:Tfp pilus assembly protein PilV
MFKKIQQASGKSQSGQTLIEVIVAVGLVVLVLLTLVSALTLAIRNNQFAKDQVLARNRSREALEWLRSLRDQIGWDSFLAMVESDGSPVTYCLDSIPSDSGASVNLSNQACSQSDLIPGTKYIRELVLTTISNEQIEAMVTVEWTEGGKDHQSQSTLILRKWL